jgi:D-alanyl-D-alanine carboxypeptidase
MSRFALLFVLAACGSSTHPSPVTAPPVTTAPPVMTAPPVTPTPPPTAATTEPHAAKRFDAWLAALNSADVATLVAFREANVSPDAKGFPPAEEMRDFREQTSGFVLVKVEESTPMKQVALVRERDSDVHARVVLEVEPAAPHRILRFDIRAITTPDELLPPRLSEADALSALRAYIEKRVAADQFSGAVLVAKQGKPIFVEAYGFADREKQVKNTVDTRFRMGSMNKMFTAVAMLQLAQAGKVKLDAPIGTYLKNYPNQQVATKVTPHHLLSHTGGTGDIFGPEFERHRLTLRTHADYLKLYGARDLDHEPGAEFRYSNYGFVLAGAVIEAVTRKPYYDAIAANVYAKAGMKATASPPESDGLRGRVVAYTRETSKQPWKSAADTLPWRGTAAGGGDTTVRDLLAFANALTNGRLIDAKYLALATTSQVPKDTGRGYGYGFAPSTYGNVRCYGHGGGAPGMNGQLFICDSGYTIAVLSNLDPPSANRISDYLVLRLPAK